MKKSTSLEIMEYYVRGQASLGYANFEPGPEPSDVVLATFPKSGSTWMSYVLHQLRSEGDEQFRDIKDEVLDITPGHWEPTVNPFLLKQRFSPRTFKTHGSYRRCPKGARYIYIARDPKDGFISLYHFIHDLFALEEWVSWEDFYSNFYLERFGTDHDIGNVWNHLLDWHFQRDSEELLWLHYEDLLENFPACLRAIAACMNVEIDDSLLKLVLERSSMDHMRKISRQINSSQFNYVGRTVLQFCPDMSRYACNMSFGKMRKGVRGDGHQNLPEDILAKLDEEWTRRIEATLGYRDYEEMRRECSILGVAT